MFSLHCLENCKNDNLYLLNMGKDQFLRECTWNNRLKRPVPREYLSYTPHKSGLPQRQTYETLYKHVINCIKYLCKFMSHLYIIFKHISVCYCFETVPEIHVKIDKNFSYSQFYSDHTKLMSSINVATVKL